MLALFVIAALLTDPTTEAPTAAKAATTLGGQDARQAAAKPLSNVFVTVRCAAEPAAEAGTCEVIQDSHPGLGFAEAAIVLVAGAMPAPGEPAFVRTIQFLP